MTTQSNCRKCDRPVPPRPGDRGRPLEYCSTACRRLVEYEIRRLTRRLEVLSDAISAAHVGWGAHQPASVPRYEAEVARLEARFRELVGDTDLDNAGADIVEAQGKAVGAP